MDWNPEEDRKLFETLLTVASYGEPDPELTALLKEQLALREQLVEEEARETLQWLPGGTYPLFTYGGLLADR